MGPESKWTEPLTNTTEKSEDDARENAASRQTAPMTLDANTISAKASTLLFKRHVCSLMVASNLMCQTILKTIESEYFLRQQSVKVDRRLEDRTVPKP